MIPSCKGRTYTERLKVLAIPALKYRRYGGYMIETFKILHGIYCFAPDLPVDLRLCNKRK